MKLLQRWFLWGCVYLLGGLSLFALPAAAETGYRSMPGCLAAFSAQAHRPFRSIPAALQEPRCLGPGQSRQVDLRPGSEYSLCVQMPEEEPVLFWVGQYSSDLRLRLHRDADESVLLNAANHFRGRELILLEAGAARQVRIDVLLALAEPPAHFVARVDSLKGESPQSVAALRALMQAALARAGDSPEPQRAVDHLDEAVSSYEALEDLRGQADAVYQRAAAKREVGKVRSAVDDLRTAVALWERIGQRDMQAMARNSLGLMLFRLTKTEEARREFSAAIEIFKDLGDEFGLSAATANECLTVHAGGDLAKARECYGRALELGRRHGITWIEAIQHNNLARVADLQGEPDEAHQHYQKALEIYEKAERPTTMANILQNQAILMRRTGDVQEAMMLYRKALEIYQRHDRADGVARTLTSLGRAYLELGEVDRASGYFRQALPLRRQVGDRRGEGHTLVNLAGALQEAGEMEASLPHLEQALSLYRELKYPQGTVSVLRLMGRVHAALGNVDQAEESFQESLQAARQLRRPLQEAAAHRLLGSLKAERGEFEPALVHLDDAGRLCASVRPCQADTHLTRAKVELAADRPEQAGAAVDQAISIIESLRERISSPERRASYLATQREAYQLKIDLLMDRHWREPSRGFDQQALEFSERGRTRALVEYLREVQSDIADELSDETLKRREELRRSLNFKAAAQSRAASVGNEERAGRLEHELSDILSEIDALEAAIRRRHPRYAKMSQPTSLSVAQIRELLDEETVLLEFALSARGDSHLWWVSADMVRAFRLPEGQVLEEASRQAFAELSRFDPQARGQGDAVGRLSRLLLEPVADLLETAKRLVVVSDGALHYIPLAALTAPDSSNKPLLEAFEIVHLPSASALALQRDRLSRGSGEAPCRAAVLADPVFSTDDERLQDRGSAQPARDSESGEFERLFASHREAQAVLSLAPQGEARSLTGFQATLQALHSPQVRRCRVLHFATHGWIDDRRPELSGLVLSQYAPDGSPQDGYLRMLDVYALDLEADLVVLSGCQTADGKMVGGEGLVGLTRGFMQAGVPRVVASLWQVRDRATAQLMSHFYQGLWRDGLAPAAALRQAQMQIRRDRRWRDPFFWAAFVLQGDWR